MSTPQVNSNTTAIINCGFLGFLGLIDCGALSLGFLGFHGFPHVRCQIFYLVGAIGWGSILLTSGT